MDIVQRIREICKELRDIDARKAALHSELYSLLDLNSGSRAPKRKMLSKEEARALFRRGA